MTLNELLAKEVIRNQVDLQRLEARIRRAALSELIRLDRVLVGLISQQGGNPQISGLLSLARKEIIKHVDDAKKAALLDEERMIKALAKKTAGDINAVLGAPLATPIMSDKLIAATKAKAIVQGAPASQWWNRQRDRTYQHFADIVRSGYVTGRTNQQIISDWRRQSGSLKNQATALVRTSVQSMANATQMAVYEENSNVVKGVQAVATLDLRTSGLCRARDGEVWYFGKEGLPKKAPAKKPPSNSEALKQPMYHVTLTENLPSIEKDGLKPFQPTNWVKAGDGTQYGNGAVFAFEKKRDAISWAMNWDWANNNEWGSGDISIIEFMGDPSVWEDDPTEDVSKSMSKGRWLRKMAVVSPDRFNKILPFTMDMVKEIQ